MGLDREYLGGLSGALFAKGAEGGPILQKSDLKGETEMVGAKLVEKEALIIVRQNFEKVFEHEDLLTGHHRHFFRQKFPSKTLKGRYHSIKIAKLIGTSRVTRELTQICSKI